MPCGAHCDVGVTSSVDGPPTATTAMTTAAPRQGDVGRAAGVEDARGGGVPGSGGAAALGPTVLNLCWF